MSSPSIAPSGHSATHPGPPLDTAPPQTDSQPCEMETPPGHLVKHKPGGPRSKWLPDTMITLLDVVVSLTAVLVGFYEYEVSAAQDHVKFQEDLKQAETARLHDYAMTYGQNRAAIYLETVQVASVIASRPPRDPDRSKAEKQFWQIYWGRIALVEDDETKSKMQDFGACMNGSDPACRVPEERQPRLAVYCFRLACACRNSQASSYQADDQSVKNEAANLLADNFLP